MRVCQFKGESMHLMFTRPFRLKPLRSLVLQVYASYKPLLAYKYLNLNRRSQCRTIELSIKSVPRTDTQVMYHV